MHALRGFRALTVEIQEIDDLVEDWTPEPLVAKPTVFEEADIEKRPVIVGSDRPIVVPERLLTSL